VAKFIPHTEEKHKAKKELVDFLLKHIVEKNGQFILKFNGKYGAEIELSRNNDTFYLDVEDRAAGIISSWALEND